jgi:pyrimidine-nucleoside phosphorylase
MAITINGMTSEETAYLTEEMRVSGEVWDLSDIPGLKIDKHSTGGVGDKVSLILGPMVASCGAKMAKMSGRGLGHTGGTLDKMESIPGMKINLTKEEFKKQVQEIGVCIIGQSEEIDPADKKLYSLRDVTGTVQSIPLIASSIMSKKLASGADCILLDVKCGKGAFMKTYEDAKILATEMVNIGKELKKNVKAEITDMNQPLGKAVGNNLEIKEVIETLKGNGPKDLEEICLSSGAILLTQAELFKNTEDAKKALIENIKNGKAFEKFKEFVKAQGGDIDYIDHPEKFPVSKNLIEIKSENEGYIKTIDALTIGLGSCHLGGGRLKMDDVIDMSAGIILNKKVGDHVKKGELLCTLHTNKDNVDSIIKDVKEAFIFQDEPIKESELFKSGLIE